MGDGTLVQLDKKDITMITESILLLRWHHDKIIKDELVPFLEYLLAETGEAEDKELLTPNKIARGLKI
jgi:hypothetical protein